mmetsp:Transcript_549/g.1483  ORF Transcript_549/g.1483 Transcript_549/m.1483 type:complete len:207 (+) Transcript_549:582-1202(+)
MVRSTSGTGTTAHCCKCSMDTLRPSTQCVGRSHGHGSSPRPTTARCGYGAREVRRLWRTSRQRRRRRRRASPHRRTICRPPTPCFPRPPARRGRRHRGRRRGASAVRGGNLVVPQAAARQHWPTIPELSVAHTTWRNCRCRRSTQRAAARGLGLGAAPAGAGGGFHPVERRGGQAAENHDLDGGRARSPGVAPVRHRVGHHSRSRQ